MPTARSRSRSRAGRAARPARSTGARACSRRARRATTGSAARRYTASVATKLSVNVNKFAVLRNSRGGSEPDPVDAARAALAAGARGITVHPRPDQRHIRVDDVARIAAVVPRSAEYNIEGNPFAPARGTYPGLVELVQSVTPAQVTLVPDGDAQITSDHGFDLERDAARLAPLVRAFKAVGCRVSLFMDVDSRDIERVAEVGADRIEI